LKRLGTPLIELQQVDSTNNYATALAHAGRATHGTAVLAKAQTAGKGQRHKGWQAQPGANITLSLILRPEGLQLAQAFTFSMAVALGVQRFFSRYAGAETFVKWPNDLFWRDRKAGGILIENILSGSEWKWAIAGLGININQTAFGPLADRAVSLLMITGKKWPIPDLVSALFDSVGAALEELQQDPAAIIAAYHDVLYARGQCVKLRKDSRVFEVEVIGVTPEGALRVRHGIEEQYQVGEVEWVF